jgi:ribosome maturation factor RimP
MVYELQNRCGEVGSLSPLFFFCYDFPVGVISFVTDFVDRIRHVIEPVCTDLGLELLEICCVPRKKRSLVRIIIDSETAPITLDDCAKVSRNVSRIMDLEDPITNSYQLEVSSPGFKRLLRVPKDLGRFVDHKVRVKLKEPLHGRSTWIGILSSPADPVLIDKTEIGPVEIPYRLIQKANLDD